MFNTLYISHQLLFFQSTKGAPASISPTTAADPSHLFRMTFNVPLIMAADPSHSLRMTFNVSLTTTANPLLLFRMTPNGNHMLRILTHS